MDNERLAYLFERYFSKSANSNEVAELAKLVEECDDKILDSLLAKGWEKFEEQDPVFTSDQASKTLHHILAPTLVPVLSEKTKALNRPVVRRIFRWGQIAAAVVVLALIGVGSYFIFFNKSENKASITSAPKTGVDIKAPETNRAMITLADGQKVYLDSVANGKLMRQSGVEIIKLADGKIVYKGSTTEVAYNTVSNPRGSKVIDITLTDGSRVWLNVGSSITYPVAFVGIERKISIVGEAYFEVMQSVTESGAKQPFIVEANGIITEVLGTHFNVNAYDDEADIKVTLLEGSVSVSNSKKSVVIKPGEQARGSHNFPLEVGKVDLEKVMAWKEGWFEFDNTGMKTIMQQLRRWYDLDIIYEADPGNEKFGGRISKELPISDVLRSLDVKYKFEKNKLVIQP